MMPNQPAGVTVWLLRTAVAVTLIAVAACDLGESTPKLRPLSQSAVVLAFGDSLTFGTGATAETSYPAVLAGLIGRRVIRSGVPGEVTAAGQQRLASVISRYQPALVILCHGGNDILRRVPESTAEANLRAMIAQAEAAGAQVLLVGVPKPGLFLSDAPLYQRLAEEFDLPYLDESVADILKDSSLKSDTIHPNAAGYRKLAEDIAELLKRAGAI